MSDSSDRDGDVQQEQNPISKERLEIREQMATMSFEDLQKLKEKIGFKMCNELLFGSPEKKKHNFKRANKNRPREESSKRPLPISRNLVKQINSPRDPRFDPLCGSYDEKIFKSNYKFVNNIRKKEKGQLQKMLNKEEDPKEKSKIKFLLQRTSNQIREHEKREKVIEQETNEKKERHKKLKNGEWPLYVKKSEKRLENLVSKYETLKSTNKLQKHIEKRSKKLVKNERRNMESIK